jgi:Tfp pilus assembly protein PilF
VNHLRFGGLLLLAALAAGCGTRPESKPATVPPRVRAQQLVDSGNEAYRVGDYRLAARRYASAAVVDREDPAAYFGLGMALSKLGRDEEARDAYRRSRELARRHAVLGGVRTTPSAPADTTPAPH